MFMRFGLEQDHRPVSAPQLLKLARSRPSGPMAWSISSELTKVPADFCTPVRAQYRSTIFLSSSGHRGSMSTWMRLSWSTEMQSMASFVYILGSSGSGIS